MAWIRQHWRRLVALLVLLPVLWGGFDLAYVTWDATGDYARPADAIIVLGCNPYAPEGGPSVCMRARGGHAAALYRQGLAPWVIATGGPTEQGPTEATVLARVLEADGVPASAILRDDAALDTIQNIRNSRAIMVAHNLHSAILVTEPFHIRRATLIAHDFGLLVYPSPAPDSANWQPFAARAYNLTRDALSLMLYQVKVLTGTRD
jgi:vancomycin permeability regulator SanA